jgi:Flp pilus assembly protein TadD
MKALASVSLSFALLPLLHGADWIRITSANFELYTTSGEREARQTVETFEQVRDFFLRVRPSSKATRLPVTIVAFRNEKEYRPYAASEVAVAYYTGDEQHDYIVMSDLANERTPAAIHEYMHLLVRHSGLKMPLWLNEGFADVYSTLQPRGGQIFLGEVPQGRAYALTQQKWMPLAALFQVSNDSPAYNEKNRAGIFYAQSYLLAHMLVLSPQYKDKFSSFVIQLSGSRSAEAAFSAVYGKSLAEVNKDLNSYFRQSTISGVLFKEGFRKIEIAPAQPATDLGVGLTLARLVSLLGRQEEAAGRLRELSAAHKDSYEVEEALAYTEWRNGNSSAAIEHFRLAVGGGATSWKTNWDYARLLTGRPDAGEQQLQALRTALESKPDLVEARLMLGSELYRKRRYAQALIELRQVKSIDPEQAPALFLTMAYSAVEIKLDDEAKRYAEQAKKYARTPSEISDSEKLMQFLQQKNAPAVMPGLSAAAGGDTRPILQRHEPDNPPTPEARQPASLSITGRLTQLDCLDGPARMHVTAGTDTYTFLMRQPDKIVINGGAAAIELACGRQNKPVTVNYRTVRDEKYGTSGDVEAIEFPN